MKLPFSTAFLLGWLLFGSLTKAQVPGVKLAGFVFANAIGVAAKADIAANGKKLTTNGIEAGIASSGLGLPVGPYQIQVTAPGCEPANASVQVTVGATPILIAYLERVLDPKTNTLKNYIRLLQVPSEPRTDGYSITAVSVEPTPVAVTAGGQSQTLEFRKPISFAAKTMKLVVANAADSEEVTADEKGSYYCAVFRKADGKLALILVPQRIYQW